MATGALEAAVIATAREQLLLSAAEGYSEVVLPDKLGAIEAAAAVFRENDFGYALIGGLAVGIRSGVPRATLDVDFAVSTPVARDTLRDKLVARGFRLRGEFAHSMNFEHERASRCSSRSANFSTR